MKKIILVSLMFLIGLNNCFADNLTFKLNSATAKVTEKTWQDKYLLIAIGYTGCPDVCPTTMIDFRGALDYFDKKNLEIAKQLQPIWIGIDPTSDTLEDITAYTKHFEKRIVGLRADNFEILNNVVKQLNADYGYQINGKPVKPPLPKGYTVYHSTYIYLYSPSRELVDVFSFNLGGTQLAKKIEIAISKYKK